MEFGFALIDQHQNIVSEEQIPLHHFVIYFIKQVQIQKVMQISIQGNTILNVGVIFLFPSSVKSYNVCMGRVETYFFNINNFYEETSTGPLTNIPWTNPYR